VAFIAWLAGSLTGYAATKSIITICGVPSIDAIFVASLIYYVLSRIQPKNVGE
jgi:hypothetical protein